MRGDYATASKYLHPDLVFIEGLRPENGTFRGRDAVLDAWTEWAETWDQLEADIEQIFDAGDDRLVSVHRVRGRGKGSGVDVELRWAYVWGRRDGKVVFCQSYTDLGKALEAVGLRE